MTTIAYRDGVLAADTLVTCNGLRDGMTAKIHRVGPVLVGGCGSSALCTRFRDWVVGGMDSRCSPFEGKESGSGLLISEMAVLLFGTNGPTVINMPFYSMGSGGEVALGAMEAGATAEEAIVAAIKWDVHSGGDVMSLRLGS